MIKLSNFHYTVKHENGTPYPILTIGNGTFELGNGTAESRMETTATMEKRWSSKSKS
jgi:hypothetical protein